MIRMIRIRMIIFCMTMICSLRTFSVALLFVLLSSIAFGQGGVAAGDLHVTVKDAKGNLVANATVTVKDAARGVVRSATGDGQGGYSARQLPPATYIVNVGAPGFGGVEATNVNITVGGLVELPVSLAVATGKEVVEVTSQADLVETSRTSTTDTIGQRRIDNLPINGRNYINFTLTDSQVVRDNAPDTGAAPTSGLNMSGQRARSNLVNVDGADATDNSTNGVRSTVSQEAVQEFQIITNNYAPEYGRAAGGVVNIITRSGSNAFHGDVFGYLRNRNFQAVNPFSTVPNPAYTRVQAGAAFGGPIKKDKTYFYFSYEITRRHETGFASIGQDNFGLLNNVDLSNAFGLPAGTIQQGVSATALQEQFFQQLPAAEAALATVSPALAAGYGKEAALYATFVGGSSGIALNGSYPLIFGALAGTAIPIPPNGSRPLTQFPTSCNAAGNVLCNSLPANFLSLNSQVGNFPVFEGTSLYSLRLDHNVSNNNRLTLRANVSPSTITGIEVNGENQVFGQNAYSRTSQQTYRDLSGVFQDTWTIGNNKVNEFRFQYARRGLAYFYNTAIPGGGDVAENIPGFAYFGREPYSYVQRVEQRYQFTDNFSWTIGRHNTKFGGDFNYLPINATFTVNYGGLYDFGTTDASSLGFSNICSANGLPAALCPTFPGFTAVQSYGLGLPNELVQGYGNPTDSFSNKPLGVFWQDSWRVTPKLTLNYGVRYDVEFPPQLSPLNALAKAAYNELGLQKGIQTDTNNIQPRVGMAWDPRGDGKTVVRASYGIFYDHPLLALYFLGDASDASQSGQLVFGPGSPCSTSSAAGPGSLNAVNTFQGILNSPSCLPTVPGYIAAQQRFNTAPFTPAQASNPQFPGLFVNQNYLNPKTFFPLVFQPFGYPQAKNFVYAYSQQANFSIERDLGDGFALSLAYNFNGGRHLNRPINANTTRGDLVMKNYLVASTDPASYASVGGPLGVGAGPTSQGFAPCGVNPSGQPWVSAALTNFFRPSAVNPAIALALLSNPASAPCVTTLLPAVLQGDGLTDPCNLSTLAGCIPFSDMDANYSNGSSVYHGLSANLRKRFGNHYEFLASYTWSHAIDDSTDLQAPLAPQDSYYPGLERSNSLFDQRHRFVFSGLYQTGKVGEGFSGKLLSDWTFAPIIEFSSGRPFNIITGNSDNFQFSPDTGRPDTFVSPACTALGNPVVNSKFSPTGVFQEPCPADFNGTLLSLDGDFPRNGGVQPWTVFNDLRVSKRIYFGERINTDLIVDMFNLANRFNAAAVNPLFTNAGQVTAAYDPRQFQFALKVNW
ncbi:MAG TPA: carboxypeptidase regulatory-like domain-containing protein [Candidatus Eremiobacteraceae bacterium]|nr:carboxypeptidase regulatory-like domain-containing protein [Candidatus Eremiobacteraceae bacterium]